MKNSYKDSLSLRMRLVRAALDLSQTELAEAIGVTQRAIHKLEKGETQARAATKEALERFWTKAGITFETSDKNSLILLLSATGAKNKR